MELLFTLSQKEKADIYGIISDACHRAEKKDKKWINEPNYFLIEHMERVAKAIEKVSTQPK